MESTTTLAPSTGGGARGLPAAIGPSTRRLQRRREIKSQSSGDSAFSSYLLEREKV